MRFDKIKLYLGRMRNATYQIFIDTDDTFQFKIRTKYTEKLFTVHFRNGMKHDKLNMERPRWYYYYLQYEQDNVPCRDRFCTIAEWKWYPNEDAVLFRIQTLKNRYKY